MIGDAFPWFVLLRDLSVKSALLLLAAWALALGMRRASAAARHLVWRLAFAALLLLPLLSLALPPRPVPVLPAAPLVPVSLAAPLVASPVTTPPAPLAAAPPDAARPDAVGFGLPATAPTLPAHVRRAAPLAWPLAVCLLWLGGAGLAVFPLGMGWVGAVRRLRRCSPVTDLAILALAAEAGRLVGVRRPIALRSGPRVAVPVTFGLLRPVVLLPDGAAAWPAGRLRVALLHEMAHIRRGDWAVQTTARLACALFWHVPLVWPAARMLRAEAERACDDRVLLAGVAGPDYAQHLLAVAGALSGAGRLLPLAVPMAGRGALESRLRAVLTARPRRAPSRRLAFLALLLALVVLVPLAVLRPAARAARRTAPPLTPAPVVLPAPPVAVRLSPAPMRAAIAAPPAPVPTSSTPTGVPPMKPLMPVKAVALAALAAGLALPAAHAQPSAPVPLTVPAGQNPAAPTVAPANLPVVQGAHPADPLAPLPIDPTTARALSAIRWDRLVKATVAPDLTPNPLVTLDVKKVPIRQALDSLFAAGKADYAVAAGVPDDKDLVTLHLTNVPLVVALDVLLASSDPPLTYTVKGGIFAVSPLHASPFGFGTGAARLGKRLPDPFAASPPMILGPLKPGDVIDPYKTRTPLAPLSLTPAPNEGGLEQRIAELLVERAAKLAGGAALNHPDIAALDARIAELQRRLGAGEGGLMKRRPVNPAPEKAP